MHEQIIGRLNKVFSKVLDDDVHLSMTTIAHDVEDWDSLNHVRIIVEVEREFGIKISAPEIASFKNVGDMVLAIERKTT